MAQAEHKDTMNVPKEKLFAAITRYEDYPKFVDGCKSVKVERKGPGQARVTYQISMMSKEINYTLDHFEDEAKGEMRWKLADGGKDLKKNEGSWKITDAGAGKTAIVYNVDLEPTFPVPGFILKGLVSKSLPSMIKGFEKQAAKA